MKRHSLIAALVVSVAANILFIGYHCGRVWLHHAPSHEEIMAGRSHSFSSLLPKPAQEQLDAQLEAHKHEIKQHMVAANNLRKKIRKLLEETPVDDKAVAKAFYDLREEHEATQKIYHDAFVSVTKDLDAGDRRHVTKTLHQRHKEVE